MKTKKRKNRRSYDISISFIIEACRCQIKVLLLESISLSTRDKFLPSHWPFVFLVVTLLDNVYSDGDSVLRDFNSTHKLIPFYIRVNTRARVPSSFPPALLFLFNSCTFEIYLSILICSHFFIVSSSRTEYFLFATFSSTEQFTQGINRSRRLLGER